MHYLYRLLNTKAKDALNKSFHVILSVVEGSYTTAQSTDYSVQDSSATLRMTLNHSLPKIIFISILVLSGSNVYADSLEATNHVIKAEQLSAQGNSYKALYYYQLALHKDNNNVEALFALARHDFNSRHYELALTRLDKLSKIDAYNEQVFLLKSKVYVKLKNWQQALHNLDFAEQLDSERPEIQLRFESIYRAMGDEEKAQQSMAVHKRLKDMEKNKWENSNER